MSENVTSLKSEQLKAIQALVTTGQVTEAAKAANRAPKTIHAWLKQPEFIAALSQAESAALDALSRELVGLAGQAVETLRAIMASHTTTAGVRVRAAEVVLANLMKLRELAQFEQRLSRLEEMKNEQIPSYPLGRPGAPPSPG